MSKLKKKKKIIIIIIIIIIIDYDFYVCIYIVLIYSPAILGFDWLAGYTARPELLSDTLHTDSFTAHNNNNNNNNMMMMMMILMVKMMMIAMTL